MARCWICTGQGALTCTRISPPTPEPRLNAGKAYVPVHSPNCAGAGAQLEERFVAPHLRIWLRRNRGEPRFWGQRWVSG